MKQYLNLLKDVLDNGRESDDRTGVGTYSVFGRQVRFDLQQGFPLVTTKKTHMDAIVHELLWFLLGSTNVNYLQNHGVKIWDDWASENGELGPVYGAQWRSWPTRTGEAIDQIQQAVEMLKRDPRSRRNVVVAWNPEDLPIEGLDPCLQAEHGKMALAPCHCLFQFYAVPLTPMERWRAHRKNSSGVLMLPDDNDAEAHRILDSHNAPRYGLSCQLYQRSADIFLGVPFNIASYALLTMMVAKVVGMEPYEFVHTFGDLHLYKNHVEQAKLQLSREPKSLPRVVLRGEHDSIDSYLFEHIELTGYEPHPRIPAPIAK